MLGRGLALGVDDTAPYVARRVDNLSSIVDGALSLDPNGTLRSPTYRQQPVQLMTVNQQLYSLNTDELARKAQQGIEFYLR